METKKKWLLLMAYIALIFAVSSIPATAMPSSPGLWRWDKLIHATEYGLAGTGLFWVLAKTRWEGIRERILACFALGFIVGGLDELYQSTVPGRACSGYDWLADIVGATLGGIFWALVYLRTKEVKHVNHTKF